MLDKKINAAFFVIILIAILNAAVSSFTFINNKRTTEQIARVINPSVEELYEMEFVIIKTRIFINNWVYLQNNRPDKNEILTIYQYKYPQTRRALLSLSANWHNETERDSLKNIFTGYEKMMVAVNNITTTLSVFDDYQDPVKKFVAENIIETEIVPHTQSLLRQIESITASKKLEAGMAQNNMLFSLSAMLGIILGLALIIIVSIVAVSVFMSKSILSPVMKIREVILQMSRGELPLVNLRIPKNAVGETMLALTQLIDGLKRTSSFANEIGKGNFDSAFTPLSENDEQGKSLIEMRGRLRIANEADTQRHWIAEGLARFSKIMQTHTDNLQDLTDNIINNIVNYTGAHQAALFLVDNSPQGTTINMVSYYALNNKLRRARSIELKEGLIGQAVSSNKKIVVQNIDDAYFSIETGLSKSKTCCVAIIPLFAGGRVIGVVEIASTNEISEILLGFLEKIAEPLAMSIFSVRANIMTKQLLEETIKQADEMAAQKQELRWANDELTNKSKLLELSQEELKAQQDDLRQMNTELEMKAHLLQEQNLAIEEARQSLSFKAKQLEQSSKYKSAFLANMSHELRTPLNSVLILAKMLSENKNGNLTEKQIEHASVIFKAGNDLLMLINDILDLSKIEAGKIELTMEQISTAEIISDMQSLFAVLANEKGITFSVDCKKTFPTFLFTDRLRVEQIIKNLLSNALKFTPKNGKVELSFGCAPSDTIYKNERLYQSKEVLFISVTDSGIGIPEDKQKIIFEAFQQADGSTSRKFGGTGLGLAISRELCIMLGGDLVLKSIEGTGSTFTIYLPHTPTDLPVSELSEGSFHIDAGFIRPNEILDDRNNIQPNDKTLVIIEDDIPFAKMLIDLCHEFQYKAVVAVQGDDGLDYARRFKPKKIILDMQLPVVDGWSVLKTLKEDNELKNIPVYIISGMEKRSLGLKMGATGYITKPASKEDILKIFVSEEIIATTYATMPIVATTSTASNPGHEQSSITLTPQDENHKNTLTGKKVLIVDDDMRNIYSLSAILDAEGMYVLTAYDGIEGLKIMNETMDVDLVLMDIMMPNMDGYEAIRDIRKMDRYKTLPIIAITAKAMNEDRDKCLEAGASDYISKPVNTKQLINVMNAWLHK